MNNEHRTIRSKVCGSRTIGSVLKLCAFTLLFAAFVFFGASIPASAQESSVRFDVSASLDWLGGQINGQASFNLAQAGLRLPAGRLTGEEILLSSYPRLLRPYLLSLRVDSNSTIGDMIENRELSLETLEALSLAARRTPPSLSADLSGMIGRYTIFMEAISGSLIRHRRALEPPRPLLPAQVADYTGIIIIADEELPVHGRNTLALLEPCLFPKIWDTNMNLVYERQMMDPTRQALMVRYAVRDSIFRPTPSGLEGDLAGLLGPRPLHIIARQAFGIYPTDPVIDRDDALGILSSENNRRLLREGRVALVLNQAKLTER